MNWCTKKIWIKKSIFVGDILFYFLKSTSNVRFYIRRVTQINGNLVLISRFDWRRPHGSHPGVNTRSICSPCDIFYDTDTERMFYFPKITSCFTLFLHKISTFKSENIILFCLIRTTFSRRHPQSAENSEFMSWEIRSISKNVLGPVVCNITEWETPVRPTPVKTSQIRPSYPLFGSLFIWSDYELREN